jgi:hypothetical protein
MCQCREAALLRCLLFYPGVIEGRKDHIAADQAVAPVHRQDHVGGHGALAYVNCVGDMTAAFVNDPTRELDDSCVKATAVPPFYIAPWVEEADAN